MKKIAVVTGTRAEYGLLKPVLEKIRKEPELELCLYVTGMHLEEKFGRTINEIKDDGFEIYKKIDIFLQDDSPKGVARSTSLSMMGFADAFASDRPDILLVLGDRFEIFGAVSAACILGLPVAHIHGGELTEGVMDDAFRHCITKMAHLHFAAAEKYAERIVQMGEQKDRVFFTGSPAVDAACSIQLLSRTELEKQLGAVFGDSILLVTYHPVALDTMSIREQMENLFEALLKTSSTLFFTYANADSGGAEINKMIEQFVSENKDRAYCAKSLGHTRYISLMNISDGLVGNSSSGIIEAAVWQKGAVNIGMRQRGRVRGGNVIDCGNSAQEISEAVTMLFSEGFKDSLKEVIPAYGDGRSAQKIVNILKKTDFDSILIKKFNDLER